MKIKIISILTVFVLTFAVFISSNTYYASSSNDGNQIDCNDSSAYSFNVNPNILEVGANDFFENEKELYDYFDMSLCSIDNGSGGYYNDITPEMVNDFNKYDDVQYFISYTKADGSNAMEGNFYNPGYVEIDEFDFTKPIEPQQLLITFYYTYDGRYTEALYVAVDINLKDDLDVSSSSAVTVNLNQAPKSKSELNELLDLVILENSEEIDNNLVSVNVINLNTLEYYDFDNPTEGTYKVEYSYTSNFDSGPVTKTSESFMDIVDEPNSITFSQDEIDIALSDVPTDYIDLLDLIDSIKINYNDGTFSTDLSSLDFSVDDDSYFSNPHVGSTNFNAQLINSKFPLSSSLTVNFVQDDLILSADDIHVVEMKNVPTSISGITRMFNLKIMLNDTEVTDNMTDYEIINKETGKDFDFDDPITGEYEVKFMFTTEFGMQKIATSTMMIEDESTEEIDSTEVDSTEVDSTDTIVEETDIEITDSEDSENIHETGISYNFTLVLSLAIICISILIFRKVGFKY